MENTKEHRVATHAGSGDITPAAQDRSTSLAQNPGEACAVAEPPKPASVLVEARSDEIGVEEIFDIELDAEDDTDEPAFARSKRLICSASTDGQVTIHRFGNVGIALTAAEAREVYGFLADTARVWGAH